MSAFSLFTKKWVHLVISIGIVVIISNTGLPRKIAEWIIAAISIFFTTWWIQLIFWILVVVAFIFLMKFSKQIGAFITAMRERKAKAEEEAHREQLTVTAQAAQTFGEGLKQAAHPAEDNSNIVLGEN